MNMQQMMIQAQKMQRELNKALNELHEKEFTITKAGAVTLVMKGDKSLVRVEIEREAANKDDIDMVEDMIVMASKELCEKIDAEEEAINSRITGRTGGFGF